MYLTTEVHTAGVRAAIRERLRGAFEEIVSVAVEQCDEVLARAQGYSPMASGEMYENFMFFQDGAEAEIEGGAGYRIQFGIARGLRSHEVRFERGDWNLTVHTDVGQHFWSDEESGESGHCSHELVDAGGLRANRNAQTRPLARAMVDVWGQSMIPTNAASFQEGRVNYVEINPLIPRVEASVLMADLRAAVERRLI